MSLISDYLIIQNNSSLLRIAASDILYIEADGNYCTIFLADGSKEIVTRKLKEIKQLMEEHFTKSVEFVRLGRSIIVNLDYVYSIDCTNHRLVLVSHNHTKTNLELSSDILRALMQLFNCLVAQDNEDRNARSLYERV